MSSAEGTAVGGRAVAGAIVRESTSQALGPKGTASCPACPGSATGRPGAGNRRSRRLRLSGSMPEAGPQRNARRSAARPGRPARSGGEAARRRLPRGKDGAAASAAASGGRAAGGPDGGGPGAGAARRGGARRAHTRAHGALRTTAGLELLIPLLFGQLGAPVHPLANPAPNPLPTCEETAANGSRPLRRRRVGHRAHFPPGPSSATLRDRMLYAKLPCRLSGGW